MIKRFLKIFVILALTSCATNDGKRAPDVRLEVHSSPDAGQAGLDSSQSICSSQSLFNISKAMKHYPNPHDVERYREGTKLSLVFSDNTISEVVSELSNQFEVPIILDERIETANISAFIANSTFLDALEVVLAITSLDFSYNGKYFYIGTYDGKSVHSAALLGIHHQYKAVYQAPETLVTLLNPAYKDIIKGVNSLGSISIFGPLKLVKEIIDALHSMDQPSEQIMMKLTIVEVEKEALSKIGRYQGSMGTGGGIINSLSPIAPAFEAAVLTKETATQFLNTVAALSVTGQAEIKAEPKILTKSGVNAQFKSTKTIYTNTGNVSSGSSSSKRRNDRIEVGVEMSITPQILPNNEISLEIIDAKLGDIDLSDENSKSTKEHSIKTRVVVPHGQTLLLGGMLDKRSKEIVNKIPLLGDIPFIGWLFKSKRTETSEVEIFFTITPELICK